jgi:O-antigen/teichoic acid export membrane protein
LKKSVFYNSSITILRQILSLVIGLVTATFIARILGPEKQGQYTLAILLPMMLFTFFNSGVSISTVYFVGQKKYSDSEVYHSNFFISILLSFVSILVGLFVVFYLSDFFFANLSIQLLLYTLLIIPIIFIQKNLQSFLHSKENFQKLNFVVILNQLGLLFFSLIFIWLFKLAVLGAILSFACTQLLMAVVSYFIIKKEYSLGFSLKASFPFLKESLIFGLKGHLSNILTFLSYRIDIFLIAYFLDDVRVGVYSIAVLLVERVWLIPQALSSVLFARISNLKTDQEKTNFTAFASRNTLFITFIIGVGLAVISPWLINFLFGVDFKDSVSPFLYMIPGVVLFSLSKVLANDFTGRGFPEINSYVALVVALINVALNVILIPKIGLLGAALATSICYGTDAIIKVIHFSRYNKISFFKFVFIRQSDFNFYKNKFNALLNYIKQ